MFKSLVLIIAGGLFRDRAQTVHQDRTISIVSLRRQVKFMCAQNHHSILHGTHGKFRFHSFKYS